MAASLADLRGVATAESDIVDNHGSTGPGWGGFYRHHPVPTAQLAPFKTSPRLTVKKTREFEDCVNVDVRVKSIPLNDKARLHDALKLISLQGPENMRELALKALEG